MGRLAEAAEFLVETLSFDPAHERVIERGSLAGPLPGNVFLAGEGQQVRTSAHEVGIQTKIRRGIPRGALTDIAITGERGGHQGRARAAQSEKVEDGGIEEPALALVARSEVGRDHREAPDKPQRGEVARG